MDIQNGSNVDPKASYVLSRLREDSRHTAALAAVDGEIGHPGVKGRSRELLMNNLLMPWLPAAVGCGTGIIVDHEQHVVSAGQDDIVLFDQMLAPSILASSNSTHGVYLFDNVLCRVEVKSRLARSDLESFAQKSRVISELKLAAPPYEFPDVFGALNYLVAFDTNVARGLELAHLRQAMQKLNVDPNGGVVSGMCIANRGFWALARTDDGTGAWKQLRITDAHDPLAYFVGFLSNSCFSQRSARLGIRPLGGGVGLYLDHPFDWVDVDA